MTRVNIKETNLDFYGLSRREYTDMIVIHHTGSITDIDASAAQIHEWHLNQGWSGIGYHFVVRKDGTIERGRPEYTVGSHTYGENSHTIGIHISGDFNVACPTDKQIEMTAMLIAELCERYGITSDRAHIVGHCDLMSTDCPGANLYSQLQTIIGKANWYRYDGKEKVISFTPSIIKDDIDVSKISVLSRKYESNNNPALISDIKGDIGGKSYGIYQFSSSVGSVKEFLDWLCIYPDNAYANYGKVLSKYEINSDDFMRTWYDIGTIDYGGFSKLQDEYVKAKYYDEAVRKLAENDYSFHVQKHSVALKAVIFSRAVQNGLGKIIPLFEQVLKITGQPNLTYIDDKYFDGQIIEAIYKFLREECDNINISKDGIYRSPYDFVHGSYILAQNLKIRFLNERNDAMKLLIQGSL